MSSVGSPYVFGTKKGDTIEERINNLEEEISIIRKNIFDVKNEMIGMINKKEVEYKEKFEDVNKSLKKIKEKIETTVIGDYRWPIFSGNLVINGLILSMIPC